MDGKRLFAKRDIWLLAGALALAAIVALVLQGAPRGAVAVVTCNGREVARQELSAVTAPETLTVIGTDGKGLTVTLYPDGAAVTEASCPDQVCVRTGKITRTGESAVCLPGRVVLQLEGGKGAVDATTY